MTGFGNPNGASTGGSYGHLTVQPASVYTRLIAVISPGREW